MIDQAVAKSGAAGGAAFLAGLMTGPVDVATLLGAFAGAVVFVMSATEYHWVARIVYLLPATTIGYLSSAWTAEKAGISPVLGAVLGGLLSIIILNGVIKKAKSGTLLSDLVSRFQGGGK